MADGKLLKAIRKASSQDELDLSRLQLTVLPPEIGQLRNLQILNLTSNQLTALPPEIGQLPNLRHLYLS